MSLASSPPSSPSPEQHKSPPEKSPPRRPALTLEGMTGIVLLFIALGLGWILVASSPERYGITVTNVEIAVSLALMTIALLLIALAAFMKDRS